MGAPDQGDAHKLISSSGRDFSSLGRFGLGLVVDRGGGVENFQYLLQRGRLVGLFHRAKPVA